jgi:choline dehydrogenase-like flavoprotein
MATVVSPPAPAGQSRPNALASVAATLASPERRLRLALLIAGAVLLAETGVYLLPAVVGGLHLEDDWIQAPFVINSVVKAGVLGLLCLTVARDVRERSAVVLVVIAAFLIWVPAGGLVLLFGDTGTGEWVFEITVAGVIFQGALALLFYLLYRSARDTFEPADRSLLTGAERLLRLALLMCGVVLLAETAVYLLPAIVPILDLKDDWFHAPFVVNSVVKAGVLGLVCLLATRDVRRYAPLVVVLIAGFAIWVPSGILILALGDTSGGAIQAILVAGVVFQALCALLFLVLYRRAQRARWRLSFLSLGQFRSLAALAEVVITDRPDQLEVPPEEVARRVDGYFARFRGRRKWVYKVTLSAFLPLWLLPRTWRRRILERWFYGALRQRRIPQPLRKFAAVGIRMAKQLCYAGYYGDPRTWKTVGYEPFSERAEPPDHRPSRLEVTPSDAVTDPVLYGDIVIVGSGAAGSILAHELIKRTGRNVLLLERGAYVPQDEFTEDEAEMLGKLYADGALQLSDDFQFQVLQGSCVGGTTVVNNAVSFRLPNGKLTEWNSEYDAGLDPARLLQCFDYVETLIGVRLQEQNLNPGAVRLVDRAPDTPYREVQANIADCLGCGYCNIGCKYGRKLSMLDGVLPAAQKAGNGRLRIVPGCEAETLECEDARVRAAHCRLDDGWRVRVVGNTFIVAAGAIASSLLLLKSQIATHRAGQGLSFNMGAPITGVAADQIRSYAGLQISHYASSAPAGGYLLETWFNPPVAQALTMPGWFSDHFRNMRRYCRMTSVGVLVGTKSNGSVRPGGLTGQVIDYTPRPEDVESVVDGLTFAGESLFEADFKPVLPHTLEYKELCSPAELAWLGQFTENPEGLTLGTGHPQGGNRVAPSPQLGVVDPHFKVHDLDNLYLCDASVFPTSVGVNPQLTVMALAAYAAGHFVEAAGGGWPY